MKTVFNEEPVGDRELKLEHFCLENCLIFEKSFNHEYQCWEIEVYKRVKVKKSFFDYFFKEGRDIPFKRDRRKVGRIFGKRGYYSTDGLVDFLKFVNIYEKIYKVEIKIKI